MTHLGELLLKVAAIVIIGVVLSVWAVGEPLIWPSAVAAVIVILLHFAGHTGSGHKRG